MSEINVTAGLFVFWCLSSSFVDGSLYPLPSSYLFLMNFSAHAEEAEVERFYEDLQDLLELTPQKDVFFIIGK